MTIARSYQPEIAAFFARTGAATAAAAIPPRTARRSTFIGPSSLRRLAGVMRAAKSLSYSGPNVHHRCVTAALPFGCPSLLFRRGPRSPGTHARVLVRTFANIRAFHGD